MVSTDFSNDTSFNFQSSTDFEGLWDQTFDISSIDAGSFTTGLSSIDGASAALILTMDAMVDIDLLPLDNIDFTSGDVRTPEAIASSISPRASCCEESIGCLMSQEPYQNAKSQDSMDFNFGNTDNCHSDVEECVPVPWPAPLTLSTRPSKHKSELASLDTKISPGTSSSPPSAKKKKLSIDIGESPPGTQGRRGSKTAHSIVERKYRESLNSKLAQLQQILVTTDDFSQENSQLFDEVPSPSIAKLRKGDILVSTIEYIQHAEIDKRHMSDEINLLRSRITAMERVNECGDCSVVNQWRALPLQVPVQI